MLRYLALIVCSVTCLAVGVFAGLLHDDGLVADGVYVQGIALGGLTEAEARRKLIEALGSRTADAVTLRLADRAWTIANSKFGRRVRWDQAAAKAYALGRTGGALERARTRLRLAHHAVDLPVPVEQDTGKLRELIATVAPQVDREPVNARVVGMVGSQLYFGSEQDGLKLEVEASARLAAGDGSFPPPPAVDLQVTRVEPKVRVAQLRDSLNTRLAAYTTSMADGYYGAQRENRSHNVRLCLARMNGTVLGPGEVFSFNERLGERRTEDGFRSSYTFRRKPDGTIEERWETGGGICQLATTLFNAVLYADLDVTERQNHSKPVHYARPGRDATVYFGVVDLKFQNNLSNPVMLWGELSESLDLTINVWGDRTDDTDVDLVTDGWYGPHGPGGELYRTVRDLEGNVLVNREHLFSSAYRTG